MSNEEVEIEVNPELEKIRTLWDANKNKYLLLEDEKKEIKKILEDWGTYYKKIIATDDNALTLTEYTNLVGNGSVSNVLKDKGEYLCNFLGNTSNTFGNPRITKATSFMVKMNGEKKDAQGKKIPYVNTPSYSIENLNDEGNYQTEGDISSKKAEKYYVVNIKPMLNIIVTNENLDDIIKKIDNAHTDGIKYKAYPILMKIAVLCYPTEFLYIYKEKHIDDLYKDLIPNGTATSRLQKNYDVFQKLKEKVLKGKEENNDITVDELKKQAENCTFIDNDKEKFNEIYAVKSFYKFIWDYISFKIFDDKDGRNIILHGPPGNGKTYLVKKYLDFKYPLESDRKKYSKEIQFHPSYTYEDFIDGLKPTGITVSGQLKLELVNGHFKQFCIEASKDLCNDYYFVVDEINRANLSSVFGELLTQLEYRAKPLEENKEISLEDWRNKNNEKKCECKKIENWSNLIELQNSKLSNELNKEKEKNEFYIEGDKFKFGIPENVYFIGMMNDVDKSIESFDLALRRRYKWIKMECDYEVIKNELKINDNNIKDSYKNLCEIFNKYISQPGSNGLGLGKQYELGHSYFLKINDYANGEDINDENLIQLFNSHIEPILTEYLRLNFEEIDVLKKIDEARKKFQFNEGSKLSSIIDSEIGDILKHTKNLILHGPPGTGKTFKIKQYLNDIDKDKTMEVQFHPSYTYEDFIDGLKPTGINKGQLQLQLVNGHFKDFCIKASKDLENNYYFVVDEINRANLSSVFGELLTQLEYRSIEKDGNWSNLIELQNSKLSNVLNKDKKANEFTHEVINNDNYFKFGIPENVYFIGMMNDVDKSIESFDLALRRRFKWKKMECDYDVIANVLNYDNIGDYVRLCEKFNNYISQTNNNGLGLGKQYELGHSYFLKITNYAKRKTILNTHLKSLFDDHIEAILTEYLRLNFEEIEIESKIKEARNKFQFPKEDNQDSSE